MLGGEGFGDGRNEEWIRSNYTAYTHTIPKIKILLKKKKKESGCPH